MWVSKKKWSEMHNQIQTVRDELKKLRGDTERAIYEMAKRILEQPEQLLEEIKDAEDIERMVCEFTDSR